MKLNKEQRRIIKIEKNMYDIKHDTVHVSIDLMTKLGKVGDLGITVFRDINEHKEAYDNTTFLSYIEMSDRLNISVKKLQKVLKRLVNENIIKVIKYTIYLNPSEEFVGSFKHLNNLKKRYKPLPKFVPNPNLAKFKLKKNKKIDYEKLLKKYDL